VVYESTIQVGLDASGEDSDPDLFVRGYVHTQTPPGDLILVGDSGQMRLRGPDLGSSAISLDLGNTDSTVYGIASSPDNSEVRLLAGSFDSAGDAPIDVYFGSVAGDALDELLDPMPPELDRIGTISLAEEQTQFGPPLVGDWGTIYVGVSGDATELRRTWLDALGRLLVFNRVLRTAEAGVEYRRAFAAPIAEGLLLLAWVEENTSAEQARVRGQLFTCHE
jgi:hypothetical protein